MTTEEQLNDMLEVVYGASLESFIAERTRLVGELRKAGDKAGAAHIAKAAKPTVSAWATNQLARREPEALQRLVDAGARMRDAQMSGADRDAFAAATAAHREALGELRQAAERILVEGGHGASPAVLERVARNLRAAGASDELARQIQAGRLAADVEAESLDGFAALAGTAPPPAPAPHASERAAPAPAPPRAPAAAHARAEAKAEEQRRARERVDRERELARARRAVEETTIRASRTREAAVRARRAADEAEAEAATAETAAAAARQALAEAQRALFSLAPGGEG